MNIECSLIVWEENQQCHENSCKRGMWWYNGPSGERKIWSFVSEGATITGRASKTIRTFGI